MATTSDLAGKVVVLVGATSGLGEATALRLARRGASLVLAGRRADRGEAVATAANAAGANAIFVRTDVTDSAAVKALFDAAEAKFGGVDVVFANAGVASFDNFLEQDGDAALHSTVDVNIKGTTLVARHGINALVRRGSGSLILTSSIIGSFANGAAAMFGKGNAAAIYAASKSYVDGLARSLHGSIPEVRTYNVAPSVYATDMPGDAAASLAGIHAALKGVPGQPDELAQIIEAIVDQTTAWAPGSLIATEGALTYDGHLRYAAAYSAKAAGVPALSLQPEELRDFRGKPAGLTQADLDARIKAATAAPATSAQAE